MKGSEHIFLSKKGCRQPRLLCANGQLIPEGWSSTEYDNNNAWKLRMSDGNRNNNNKNNNNNKYVRPVLAYLVKNIIKAEPEFLSSRWRKRAYFFIKKGLPTVSAVMCQRAVNTGRVSSTENSNNNAWKLDMSDGGRNLYLKNHIYNAYVRPVLAYLVKNIIMSGPEFLSPRWGKQACFFYQKRAADSCGCYVSTGS